MFKFWHTQYSIELREELQSHINNETFDANQEKNLRKLQLADSAQEFLNTIPVIFQNACIEQKKGSCFAA